MVVTWPRMTHGDDHSSEVMDAEAIRPCSDDLPLPPHRPVRELCLVTPSCRRAWDSGTFRPIPAKDAYTGPFTRKCQGYAERFYPGAWCILDPRHGFMFPEEIIRKGHGACLFRPWTGPIGTEALRSQVRSRRLDGYERIVVLGGHRFICLIEEAFPHCRVRAPLTGLGGIGHMMREMNLAIGSGQRL